MAASGAAGREERVELIDALRGFALFGILLANILYWSGWIFMRPEERIAVAGSVAVEWQHIFHHALVDGKFYSLFSLLFGLGFALQLERLNSRGLDGLRIFRRRLLILLAIGVLHMVLLWDGDILTLYALLGLLLPFFRQWDERSLLAASAMLIFAVPLLGHALFESLGWRPHQPIYDFSNRLFAAWGGTPDDAVGWLQREDPGAFFAWVLTGWPFSLGTRLESWRIPKVLGIMLLGMVIGRRLMDGRLPADRRLVWTILLAGSAVGVPLSLAYALSTGGTQTSPSSVLGTVPLALAYAAAFALAWPRGRRLLGVFAAPGRMALTNYLMHSLLGILVFYGIGAGLVGTVGPAVFYTIAAAIFAAQILASHWWLARHKQGPVERLWRAATYRGMPVARGTVRAGRDGD